ncbi:MULTISPECIES: hypothetical protein [unclassified Desulfovibrio]|uniref:VgrG-related protein n=1 Tax=unclassified Desulfovibrio TaxID=2593640 RepID=UPI0013ED2706|nr:MULTISPECIES: hypothetical protein [unclassified Desulfovibrio]
MSHSAWLIRPPAEQQTQAPASGAASGPISGKKAQASPDKARFAALMAGEKDAAQAQAASQNAAGKAAAAQNTAAQKAAGNAARSAQFQPQVARLPEDNTTLPLRNTVLAGRSPSDLLRAQNFTKAQADIAQTRAMDGLMQGLSGGSALDMARNMGAARQLRSLTRAAANNGRGFALTSADFIHTRNVTRPDGAAGAQGVKRGRKSAAAAETGMGRLSARFESGGDGIAAIGYDRTGGTSYGKYQIASRVGSMKSFLNFLDGEAPDIAQRLRKAGPADTGSRKGGMPDAWRAIAAEQPERFEELQESFIRESHYRPALEAIVKRTGLEADSLSPAMREVIWSTAVQHGPAGAARIFDRADDVSGKPEDAGYERKLISNVYQIRAGQFGSSTAQVQQAVRNRFRQERELALNMLDGGSERASLA